MDYTRRMLPQLKSANASDEKKSRALLKRVLLLASLDRADASPQTLLVTPLWSFAKANFAAFGSFDELARIRVNPVNQTVVRRRFVKFLLWSCLERPSLCHQQM